MDLFGRIPEKAECCSLSNPQQYRDDEVKYRSEKGKFPLKNKEIGIPERGRQCIGSSMALEKEGNSPNKTGGNEQG